MSPGRGLEVGFRREPRGLGRSRGGSEANPADRAGGGDGSGIPGAGALALREAALLEGGVGTSWREEVAF